MARLLRKLLDVLVGTSHPELRRQIQFLKAENEILRAQLPRHIKTTASEPARLVKLGARLGTAAEMLISIVHPDTFARWVRMARSRSKSRRPARRGRPKTRADIQALVLKLAKEIDWG